jgi:hypothetical protein
MKQAGIQFAISSWWGQNTYEDFAFDKILANVMPAADNPHPELKWTIYHEWEGSSDPTLEYLLSDLDYIKRNYASSPSYMKIDGKPVIFIMLHMHTMIHSMTLTDGSKRERRQDSLW